MCLYPRLIKNKKYESNKKNGGDVPPLPLIEINGKWYEDKRVLSVPVGCQKCIECKKKKAREWQVRLLEDIRHEKNGIMVTLTFSNETIKELSAGIRSEGYERDNEIAKKGVRRFLERWRKKHKKSIRHWLVTELGHEGTENIHLHGIMWTDKGIDEIRDIWEKNGYIYPRKETKKVGYVNERTVNYTVKYIHKMDKDHEYYEPKVLTSAGIGKGYLKRTDSKKNKFNGTETREGYKTKSGVEIALPMYLRNKIYNEDEREKLWQQKLDEETRYVLGNKIDISKNEEKYIKARNEARKKNKRLGYGSNYRDNEKEKEERERRNINFKKRIENANKANTKTKK